MSQNLQEIMDQLPILQQTYSEDTCLILCDQNSIIGYLPGEQIDLNIKVGESMEKYKGAATYKVLQTGRKIREEVSEDVVGIPYISSCVPIKENNRLVGALAAVTSNKKLSDLRDRTNELSGVISQMTNYSEEMSTTTEMTAQQLQKLSVQSETMQDNMIHVEKIIKQVKEVASRSNILGLNASIEAARAGEYGRGFSVVADEIRKMAANSNNAAEDIQRQLELTQKEIANINGSIQVIAVQTEGHAETVRQFHSMLEQISRTAEQLNEHGMTVR